MSDAYLQQLKRGTLEMVFLSLLAAKPQYGSEIMRVLNSEGGPYFAGAREGSVYPVFYRLEDAGLIRTVPDGRQKKMLHITEAGLRHLAEMKQTWNGFNQAVDYFLNWEGVKTDDE